MQATSKTYALSFPSESAAHNAGLAVQPLGFSTVVTPPDEGGVVWILRATRSGGEWDADKTLELVEQVAARHCGYLLGVE